MKKIYLLLAAALLVGVGANAQSFTNSSNLLPDTFNSGGVTGVTDMNNDGLDDILIMDQSTHVYVAYQQPDGSFDLADYGSVSSDAQWGMCTGDVDNDGHNDVYCGGAYDGVHYLNINGPGDYSLSDPQNVGIFMQACNLADINNDGWLDGFACHDDGPSHRHVNDGSGNLLNGNSLFDYNVYPSSDMSGNYGSLWSDFDRDGDIDLMVAKCRQFVNDPYDARRTNLLFVNDGNNNYTDEAHERGLVNLQQSWTSDFGDIDNDGDFDCFITTHSGTLEMYENDGFGFFTNITAGSGLEVSGFFLQGKLADFDNDGYLDVIYSGGNHAYYRNNGNKTWTLQSNTFPANDTMHGFAIGDLNDDGWLDVYANYGNSYVAPDNNNPDRLYLNNGGSNNWIKFDLEGTISNKGAVGALVEIHGTFGIQIREVRAGESYGITNAFTLHFGIGDATSIDYAIIHWPAGGKYVVENPSINTTHEFIESACTPPTASISAVGGTLICAGSTATLQVDNAGDSYVWSNGATGSSITVGDQGAYSVIVYDNTGCAAASNVINIELTANEAPTITVSGEVEFCEGGSVNLIASAGNAFTWSNGGTNQSLNVTQAGTYSVQVDAGCGFTSSESVTVSVFDAPATPTSVDVDIFAGQSATLTATGTDIRWYDAVDAVTPIATGNSYTTPNLTSTTSYWVEDVTTYGGVEGNGGKEANESATFGQYHNSSSFYLKFDASEDIYIESVKVYAGNTAARTIQVIDANTQVVAEGTFDIPQGESYVTLNFFVPAGTGYGLRCTNNNPQLWRDRNVDVPQPFDFPYDVNGLATITGTSVSGNDFDNYYYFFYDWTVSTPTWECASPREQVDVNIVGIEELSTVSSLVIYPNPVVDQLTLSYTSTVNEFLNVRVFDQTGRVVSTQRILTVVGNNTIRMEAANFAAGIYSIQLESAGKTAAVRFVVE